MPLTQLQIVHVCKINSDSNDTCRYLSEDSLNTTVYQCLKLTGQKKFIDESVDDYLKRQVYNDDKVPLGNNCQGYPVMRHKQVGYDVEKK